MHLEKVTGMTEYISENIIPIIIPAYEPGQDVVNLCGRLKNAGFQEIVFVDDGSGAAYRAIFDQIESKYHCKVLRHAINLGKGRAIKTAVNYILSAFPDAAGVVTADSDGQHTPEDIGRCMRALTENPGMLILGCRNFGGKDIPWKSKFGNELTKKIMSFLCGIRVSDTQTGLRGIPRSLMIRLMNIPGERFEFETNMLLESKDEYDIFEVSIETIYDSKEDHKTHFAPFRDSVMIYRVILSYSAASVISAAVDFIVFAAASGYGLGIGGATATARVCSAGINFLLNRNIAFKARENMIRQLFQYIVLLIFSGTLSALLISALSKVIPLGIIAIKAVVETCLFFFNYFIQRKYIFKKRSGLKPGDNGK